MTTSSDGKPVFRLAFGRWHIGGWPAILLAPLAVPLILLIVLAERLFGLKTSADRTARDVEGYLRGFLEGTDGDWDWDDFTSIKITDPRLDAIRDEAARVSLPLAEAGRATLRTLLEEVRSI
jgi:hypothetical protein